MHRALLFNEFDDLLYLIFESTYQTLKKKSLLTPIVKDYLADLKKFITQRKKNVLKKTDTILSEIFNFDFEYIRDHDYNVNPNKLKKLKNPIKLQFFQERDQREHISY